MAVEWDSFNPWLFCEQKGGQVRRFDEPGSYDTAQVCLDGHVITGSYHDFSYEQQKHCDQCGAATITACPGCTTEIRGHFRGGFRQEYSVSPFCHECGKPYPWTEARLQVALEMIEELEGLSSDDRAALSGTIPDLVRETPRTELAILRFKKLAAKLGKAAGDALYKAAIDVAAEAVKRSLKG